MTIATQLTAALNQSDTGRIISWHPEAEGHSLGLLRSMVEQVRRNVSEDSRQQWLVVDDNATRFLAAVLGVLAAGATPVLPPHSGVAAVRQLVDDQRGLVSGAPELADDRDVAVAAGAPVNTPIELSRKARLLLFTSGSTGEPTRVDKTLAQLEDELLVLQEAWGDLLEASAVVATVPHFHLYGLLFRLLWPFVAGRPVPELALLEPPRIAAAIDRFPRSVLVSSPAHLKRWPGYTALVASAGRLDGVFSSAGPLPASTSLALHRALDPLAVWEVYGSTETGGIAFRDQGRPEHAHWQTFAGVELAFPDAEPGPMQVRSPATGHEWLDTGDRARRRLDSAGGFELLGRSDGVIKIEDRRISLAEIETALEASDWVREAAVLRLNGERQTTAAVLALSEVGQQALEALGKWQFKRQLRAQLATRFTEVALPRRFRYLETLPRNPMGKLRRADLLALFQEGA
ncbi:acyl-coenzyme A synthetase/AMP-(fatty) acid ligase [Natronospira proteinivora]|uniref:Acyl-coenzyme A synthetase/AMP-(Fatty) acid ligase n=1 Tax=Natronospira proteinivora TaxID=1807133 RepID=A0ABT1G915_9GAMM|nr:class I adenylate-forming enzyme family protein [Natronospira proteinivora]MCP1727726.1 acyl-coenzyme A synthetase/AMP-(fatty) acid ligase [Natronospira proteinivora]